MAESLAHYDLDPSPQALPEPDLRAGFRNGCDIAFDQVVRRYQHWVARLAQRLLGYPDAGPDIVQEVFLAALRSRRSFRGDCALDTYLARITVSKCRSYQRKRIVQRAALALLHGQKAVEPTGPAEALARTEQARHIRAAVHSLAPKYREVIVLRYLEEISIAEITDILGLTRAAVDMRLTRARTQLQSKLSSLWEQNP